jgi:chemotaxis protein CheD
MSERRFTAPLRMPGSPTIASLFAQRVVIGVGDVAASNSTTVTLSTYALGSCVAVVAYDAPAHAGAILHLMLPESSLSREKAAVQPAMFADTGFPALMGKLAGLRADPRRLKLFLAGGASVLQGNDPFKIGARNIEAVKKHVLQLGLCVVATGLGGVLNRTVHLDVGSGQVTLKLPNTTESLSLA